MRIVLLFLLLTLPSTRLLAADTVPTVAQAQQLLKDGKRPEALRAFQAIIDSHPPDPSLALFEATRIFMDDGEWHAANRYARRLVKLRPGSIPAWELVVQIDQALGDKIDRQNAIDSIHTAWETAIDPAIRSLVAFVRDRIVGPHHTVIVKQTLDPGGETILRYAFIPTDDGDRPLHYMVVQSDDATNERWRQNGTVSDSTIVFHLDTIERKPDGREVATPYAFYINEPDYDQVRKTVVGILDGTAKPLSGSADPYWTTPTRSKP